MRIRRVALWIVLSCGVSGLVSAQAQSDPKAAEFGPANLTHVRIGPYDFQPREPRADTLRILRPGGMAFYSETPDVLWEAPVHLPGGALLKRIELDFCDTIAFNHVYLGLLECDNQWQNCVSLDDTFLGSDASGCSFKATSSISYRIDNFHKGYLLQAGIYEGDGTTALGGAILSYQLDVSPA